MNLASYITYTILLDISIVLGFRYFTHMLQLSSYQFQGYFRFLRDNFTKFGLNIGALCTTAFAGVFKYYENKQASSGLLMLSAVFILFLIIEYLPRQVKKKFAITKRVQRLFVTYALITVLFTVIAAIFASMHGAYVIVAYVALGIFVGCLPFLVALANLINKPIENRINQYYIDDAKKILASNPDLIVIGITGSYGKTSVKYYLTTLLSEGFRVLMTPASFNTPMGVVKTIRGDLKPTHQVFVCEMGARHVHDIKEITDIVDPDSGIITSIGPQHLETFHSMENIIGTKFELLDAVDEKSQRKADAKKHLKFVNGDNEVITGNLKYQDAISYGTKEGNDYRATDISVSSQGTTFTVTAPDGETCEFTTKLVGEHNVINIVGAIAISHSYGIPMQKLRSAVRRLAPVPHRLELIRRGLVSILDDAYNSNPAGAKVAVETLALFEDKVRILVTPGMVELGDKEAEYNEEFGRQAAKCCDYIILVGEKQAVPIKKGALEAGFDPDKLFVKKSLNEATQLMYEIDAGKEKVILLENDLPDNYT